MQQLRASRTTLTQRSVRYRTRDPREQSEEEFSAIMLLLDYHRVYRILCVDRLIREDARMAELDNKSSLKRTKRTCLDSKSRPAVSPHRVATALLFRR